MAGAAVERIGELFRSQTCLWDEIGFLVLGGEGHSTGVGSAPSASASEASAGDDAFFQISTDGRKLGFELLRLSELYAAAKRIRAISSIGSKGWQAGSRVALLLGADAESIWNERKRFLLSLDEGSEEFLQAHASEAKLLDLVLSKHFKSAPTWAHRAWLLRRRGAYPSVGLGVEHSKSWSQVAAPMRPELLKKEILVCSRVAERYPRCYNAWSHRCELVPLYCTELLSGERDSLRKWIRVHVSDASAMSYLLQVVSSTVLDDKRRRYWVAQESELACSLVVHYPGHEALWLHHRSVAYQLVQLASREEMDALAGFLATEFANKLPSSHAENQGHWEKSLEEEKVDVALLDSIPSPEDLLEQGEDLASDNICNALKTQLCVALACAYERGCSRQALQHRGALGFIVHCCRTIELRISRFSSSSFSSSSSSPRPLSRGLSFAQPGSFGSWNADRRFLWGLEVEQAVASIASNVRACRKNL